MLNTLTRSILPALAMGTALSGCNISWSGDVSGVPLADLDMGGEPPSALVLAGPDQFRRRRPAVGGVGDVVRQVLGVPGEPVTEGVPVDAELPAQLLLADLPLTGLDELHDGDVPVARQRTQHHAERRGRLALAVPGVDDDEGIGAPQPVGAWVLGGGGVWVTHVDGGGYEASGYSSEPSSTQRSSVRSRRCPATVMSTPVDQPGRLYRRRE